MAKRSRKRRSAPSVEIASSDTEFHPDATLGPEASADRTLMLWRDRESTSAPAVEDEEARPSLAAGYPALVEKLLREKIPLRSRTVGAVLILGWFGFVSWLFVQDNSGGTLGSWSGLGWFGVKASLYTVVLGVAAVALGLLARVTRENP